MLNGWELGGGSIRIHRHDLLERSFLLQGHSREAKQAKFGAVLDAFEYGAPPHGGIALGIDRWIALLTNQDNIREVQAFPKTGTGSDLMLGAPSPVEPAQLAELGLLLAPPRNRQNGVHARARCTAPSPLDGLRSGDDPCGVPVAPRRCGRCWRRWLRGRQAPVGYA